jgi:GGDEF domain-containing protein
MPQQRESILASLPRTAFALLALNLLLVGSWAWFASARLPLLIAFVGEVFALRSLIVPPRAASPEPNRMLTLERRTREIRRGSIRDESTGLYHRWYFELRLEEEAARCRRYKLSLAMIVLKAGVVDISSFHSDEWREQAGEAARKMVGIVRTVDLSTALAPLEFALCLVHCDQAGAQRAVERLITELEGFNCEAGIAVYPENNCEPVALIELARGRARRIAIAA